MRHWLICMMVGMMTCLGMAAGPWQAEATTAATQPATGNSAASASVPADMSDDFSPGMAALTLVALIMVALAAIAGAVALVILAGIALLGIVSTSTVVGIMKGSTGAAIRAFAFQALSLAGVLAGMVAGLGVHWVRPQAAARWQLIAVGGGVGAILGLILAAVLVWAVRAMWRAMAKQSSSR